MLIPDTDLDGIVAIDNNTYKFTEEAAGKTFKLEISLDASEYDLSRLSEKYTTITVEFVVVGGGYNVYDQLGLSVMNDLSSKHWAEIWKCDIDANYNLTARTDSLKLEADDKPLCEYVGKIDWVVLHSSFALDADQMPSYYFWSEESEGFETANMFYLWRANVKVVNSDLIGSGGPNLVVDKKSVLEAYATGSESWYKLYNAQALVQQITGTMELGAFNNIGKTVRFHKDQNGKYTAHTKGATGTEYVNVIAAIICEPGDLFTGLNSKNLIVRGTFTTVDEDENVVDKFDMRNTYVTNLSTAAGNNGKLLLPIFQTGSLFTYTDGSTLYTLGATGQQAFNPATDGGNWYTDTHDKLGIYMSAGSMSGSANAPYFGIVVGSAHYDI